MATGRVQWCKSDGKILAGIFSVGSCHEWIREQRRSGAGIGGSVRSIGRQNSESQGFDGCVIHSEAGSKTGFAGTSHDLAEKIVRACVRRVSESNARRKFIAGWRKRTPCSRVGGIQDSRRRAREDCGLLPRFSGRNLIIFFVPGLDAVPAQAVVESQIGL